jgi:hypothetical protein
MKWGLLEFQDSKQSIQKVTLNIRDLFEKEKDQAEFRKRLSQFENPHNSDIYTNEIYQTRGDLLIYETESLIPERKSDERTPLLLLLGNPASHSVKERMFFSFERDRQEHRFWRILDESGIFSIPFVMKDVDKRNKIRKAKLYDLDYASPFKIALATFYSMPSPAIGRWAGVAGLHRLFRKEAFKQVTNCERKRLADLINHFLAPNGIVIAFQKDAYQEIKSNESPDYSLDRAKRGEIESQCRFDPKIKIYCLAPTRLMKTNLERLKKIKTKHT